MFFFDYNGANIGFSNHLDKTRIFEYNTHNDHVPRVCNMGSMEFLWRIFTFDCSTSESDLFVAIV